MFPTRHRYRRRIGSVLGSRHIGPTPARTSRRHCTPPRLGSPPAPRMASRSRGPCSIRAHTCRHQCNARPSRIRADRAAHTARTHRPRSPRIARSACTRRNSRLRNVSPARRMSEATVSRPGSTRTCARHCSRSSRAHHSRSGSGIRRTGTLWGRETEGYPDTAPRGRSRPRSARPRRRCPHRSLRWTDTAAGRNGPRSTLPPHMPRPNRKEERTSPPAVCMPCRWGSPDRRRRAQAGRRTGVELPGTPCHAHIPTWPCTHPPGSRLRSRPGHRCSRRRPSTAVSGRFPTRTPLRSHTPRFDRTAAGHTPRPRRTARRLQRSNLTPRNTNRRPSVSAPNIRARPKRRRTGEFGRR